MKRIVVIWALTSSMCALVFAQERPSPDSETPALRLLVQLELLRIPFFQSYSSVLGGGVVVHVDRGVPQALIDRAFDPIFGKGKWISRVSPPIVALGSPAVAEATRNGSGCYAGAVGAPIKDKNGNAGYLTCNHVAAAEGMDLCPNGDMTSKDVKQQRVPSNYPAKCKNEPVVGELLGFVPIDYSNPGQNVADAAAVRASIDETNGCNVCFTGTTTFADGLDVYICRKGLPIHGKVVGRPTPVSVRYGLCGPPAGFVDQIEIDGDSGSFGLPGDSGAVVYTISGNGKGLIAGMVFAGDGSGRTFASPIKAILDAQEMKDLGVTLSFCSP